MQKFEFNTIESAVANVILREKDSKFIGYALPVRSEEEIKNHLQIIRNNHPKATHCCYASRFGSIGESYRRNDDGEPAGTAGMPIYNQLSAYDITDVLLIVVRYFGGTNLAFPVL